MPMSSTVRAGGVIALIALSLAGCVDLSDKVAGELAAYDRGRAEGVARITAIARLLKAGQCDEGLARFEAWAAARRGGLYPDQIKLFRAALAMEGRCAPRDPERAARLLEAANAIRARAGLAPDSEALARLGALYWRGDGVPRNKPRATRLFRRAVLMRAPVLLSPRPVPRQKLLAPAEHLWGLSAREIERNFVNLLTGPWDLPQPLRNQLAWIETVKAGGGPAILALSEHIRDGTGGFEQDPALAFHLLEVAADDYDYTPALFPYAMALRARKLCPYDETYCEPQVSLSDRYLIEAADRNDVRAQQAVLDLLETARCDRATPEDTAADWDEAYYYWLLRLRRNGGTPGDRLQQAAGRLAPQRREEIEERAGDPDWPGRLVGLPCRSAKK